MYSDPIEVLCGFVLGLFFGAIAMLAVTAASITDIDEYPGLSDRLTEQRDDCEARPNVLTCEWDENKVDYVPKEQANG